MVSMQRRLNSTGRKRITRDRIAIELFPSTDLIKPPFITATVRLDGIDLDEDARVALEAYFRSSSMRFACGTVNDMIVPAKMELSEIDRGGAVQFRVLVISTKDPGRILAAADGIRPRQNSESPDRQPLLRLREADLGDQLWRVDLHDRNGPWLVINSRVPTLASQLRSSAMIQGLILPHAMRIVLGSLPMEGSEEGDEDWGNDWRKFLSSMDISAEPDEPGDDESKLEWIEEAVSRFCEIKRFATVVRNEPFSSDQHNG